MKHVFISYVRENQKQVQRLYDDLTKRGINVWLDRKEIKPGYRWKDAIREAIQEGDFFIACFSKEYQVRDRTYMNEELTLAIDLLRQSSIDRAWFIPVLLSESDIPARSIGGGETLLDIQWLPLYEDWNNGIKRILDVIKPSAKVSEIQENSLETMIYRLGTEKNYKPRLHMIQQIAAIDSDSAIKVLKDVEHDPHYSLAEQEAARIILEDKRTGRRTLNLYERLQEARKSTVFCVQEDGDPASTAWDTILAVMWFTRPDDDVHKKAMETFLRDRLQLSIALKFETDLDNGNFSDELRLELEGYLGKFGHTFSANTLIRPIKAGKEWIINDIDNKETITIRKVENKLNVYQIKPY